MKGYILTREPTINDWKEQYLVLKGKSLHFYLNDSCLDLCCAYELDANSLVHCIPQYENHSHLVKLEVVTIDHGVVILYLSMFNSKDQNDWFDAIMETILDCLQLLSLNEIWSVDFQPTIKIHYYYKTNQLNGRSIVLSSAAFDRPTVNVMSRPSAVQLHYSVILVNTDWLSFDEAPTSNKKVCTYLNWAVINAKVGNLSKGKEVGVT